VTEKIIKRKEESMGVGACKKIHAKSNSDMMMIIKKAK